LLSFLGREYSILEWKRCSVSLGFQRSENFLAMGGNFFDATLYVSVRFGVSVKWVLYSCTISIIEPRGILFCFVMNLDVKWCIAVRAKLHFMAII